MVDDTIVTYTAVAIGLVVTVITIICVIKCCRSRNRGVVLNPATTRTTISIQTQPLLYNPDGTVAYPTAQYHYPGQQGPYPNQQVSYPNQQLPYPVHPTHLCHPGQTAYPGQPGYHGHMAYPGQPFGTQPTGQPIPYPTQTAPYPTHLAPSPSQPPGSPTQPVPYPTHPPPYPTLLVGQQATGYSVLTSSLSPGDQPCTSTPAPAHQETFTASAPPQE